MGDEEAQTTGECAGLLRTLRLIQYAVQWSWRPMSGRSWRARQSLNASHCAAAAVARAGRALRRACRSQDLSLARGAARIAGPGARRRLCFRRQYPVRLRTCDNCQASCPLPRRQVVRHLTLTQTSGGSNPSGAAKSRKARSQDRAFLFACTSGTRPFQQPQNDESPAKAGLSRGGGPEGPPTPARWISAWRTA